MSKRDQKVFAGLQAPKDSFGGSLLTSNPKVRRPLDSKLPVLLTLRSERSTLRTPHSFKTVNELVYRIALKHGVRIYEYANVGNHLHLLIKLRNRPSWAAFIRELTGRIAQLTATKWLYRPHTRVVRGWKKAYRIAKDYVRLNILEADGHIDRRETKSLRDLREIWADPGRSVL